MLPFDLPSVSDAIFCIAVPCQELSAPDNGQMMPSMEVNQTFHFNIIKNFSCNSGFYLKSQSSQSRRCDENGQWTGEHARCLRECTNACTALFFNVRSPSCSIFAVAFQ